MCGLTGILSFKNRTIDKVIIKKMNDSLVHRGPDAEGIWCDNIIGLGHRRLSIIDLSEASNQPMVSGDGRFVLVQNGEIYNYQEIKKELISKGVNFRTNSDTEVLLELIALDGIEAVSKLRGMFAFAIWDKRTKELILCRDRLGIKPLYYSITESQFTFGSEIKALLYGDESLRRINADSFWKYVRLMTVPKPDTIIEGIKKLEPGTYLRLKQNGDIEFTKYWDVKDFINHNIAAEESNEIEFLKDLLHDVIKYHMVADVEVGAFLSGGLDSSAVTALMKNCLPEENPISTYSINFPENKLIDEGEYSTLVANHLKTNHKVVHFTEEFINNLEEIIWHCDEPFGISSSFGVFQLSKEASNKLKVVLTGDGGDEVFGGYAGYVADYHAHIQPVRNIFKQCGSLLMKINKMIKDKKLDQLSYKLLKRSGTYGHIISENQAYTYGGGLVDVLDSGFMYEAFKSWHNRLYPKYYLSLTGSDEITRRMYADLNTRLVDEMLTKTDRMTMAHSLEARVPFLDHKLVEYVYRLPTSMKINARNEIEQKYILKKSMEGLLPEKVIYRKKKGFHIPALEWMKEGEIFDYFFERVIEGSLIKKNILNKEKVLNASRIHTNSDIDRSSIFWSLGIYEIWLERFEKEFGNFNFT